MRRQDARVLSTRNCTSAHYEPVPKMTAKVKAIIRRSGSPMMTDPRMKTVVVPVSKADVVDQALAAAGFDVDVAVGHGGGQLPFERVTA